MVGRVPDHRVPSGTIVSWCVDMMGDVASGIDCIVVFRHSRVATPPRCKADIVEAWHVHVVPFFLSNGRSCQEGGGAQKTEIAHAGDSIEGYSV